MSHGARKPTGFKDLPFWEFAARKIAELRKGNRTTMQFFSLFIESQFGKVGTPVWPSHYTSVTCLLSIY